jgi:hypothetical protein
VVWDLLSPIPLLSLLFYLLTSSLSPSHRTSLECPKAPITNSHPSLPLTLFLGSAHKRDHALISSRYHRLVIYLKHRGGGARRNKMLIGLGFLHTMISSCLLTWNIHSLKFLFSWVYSTGREEPPRVFSAILSLSFWWNSALLFGKVTHRDETRGCVWAFSSLRVRDTSEHTTEQEDGIALIHSGDAEITCMKMIFIYGFAMLLHMFENRHNQ